MIKQTEELENMDQLDTGGCSGCTCMHHEEADSEESQTQTAKDIINS